MAKNARVGTSYIEDRNAKPVKRRTSAEGIHDDIYVQGEDGELVPYAPPRRQFTQEDRERANKNRDRRHTRVWWLKRLLAIDEGDEIVTPAQFQAHMAIGRSNAPAEGVQEISFSRSTSGASHSGIQGPKLSGRFSAYGSFLPIRKF